MLSGASEPLDPGEPDCRDVGFALAPGLFALRPDGIDVAGDDKELKLLPEVTTLLTLSARLDLRRGRTNAGE